jgi:hypothetical protein
MAKSDWVYFWQRDLTIWMLVFAGAVGAATAAILIPVGWRAAAAAINTGHEEVFVALFVLPVCFLSLWAFAWWAGAARRALRMRRLLRTGVSVQATVERVEVIRSHEGFLGVALWLQYEFDGQTYHIKKKTAVRRVAAQAREFGRIELAVDPRSPKYVALVVAGRLV